MSELTPEAAAVVEAATFLIRALEGGSGAFGWTLELQRALPALEVVERRKFEQREREAIDQAAGLALTHQWEWVDGGGIQCARCPVDAGLRALRNGSVPECDPDTRCAPYADRHFITGDRCIYCKTTYPATAEREV